MDEFHVQEKDAGIRFDYIFHSSSSGGTQAGLEVGKRLFGVNAQIIGAGALVLKSIFEEQILNEIYSYIADKEKDNGNSFNQGYQSVLKAREYDYEEAFSYLKDHAKEQTLGKYLTFVEESKKSVDIPDIDIDKLEVNSKYLLSDPSEYSNVLRWIGRWMDNKGYATIEEFRGKMNQQKLKNPAEFERVQFMRLYSKIV
jgi:hypothetical protein